MKIPFRKIKKDYKSISLSQPEKTGILKSINLYMSENPVIKQAFSFKLLITQKNMIPIIIIAILAATSGGTVMAAENSLPGDMLYAVKLNVNEKVMSAMAVSDDAEADVQSKLAERRLQEYNKMLEQKKWSEEKEKQMTDRMAQYQEKTLALIERLRSEGKIELANDIYERMTAKANSFEEFVDMVKKSYANETATQMPERMKEFREKMMENKPIDNPEGLKISAERHIRNAKDAIEKLTTVYDEQKANADERLKTYYENSLIEARDYLAKAEDRFAEEAYKDASDFAKRAMQVAMKARDFTGMVKNAGEFVDTKKLEKIEELESWNEGWQMRAENIIGKADGYLQKIRNEFANRKASLSAELVKEIKAKISEATLLMARAEEERRAEKYEAASESAKSAFEKLLEIRFDSKINEVVATDWRARAENVISQATSYLGKVRAEIAANSAEWLPSFAERAQTQAIEAEAIIVKAKEVFETGKFEEAYALGKRALEQLMNIRLREIKNEIKDEFKTESKDQKAEFKNEINDQRNEFKDQIKDRRDELINKIEFLDKDIKVEWKPINKGLKPIEGMNDVQGEWKPVKEVRPTRDVRPEEEKKMLPAWDDSKPKYQVEPVREAEVENVR